MKLTISVESTGDVLNVEIPENLSIVDFKAYLQAETDISPENQDIKIYGKSIGDSNTELKEAGIKENDLIVLSTKRQSAPVRESNPSAQVDDRIEFMRQQFLNDPQANEQLRTTNPSLHSILGNRDQFKSVMIDQIQQFQSGNTPQYMSAEQQDELRRLQNNPDDPDSQARILEMIRQEQIEENMRLAYEITPESFAYVNMLYININVNGHKVQAFVDSGAQTTIISPRLAEKINVSRLIDRRFQGEARGVGSQKIEGKIHSVPITIGDSSVEIPCSFVVIDTQVDLLFGLDMLRRHKCVIDLQRDRLVVGGNIETPFLHESEIKDNTFRQGAPKNKSGLGGNIFSDVGSIEPANSTPTPSTTSLRPNNTDIARAAESRLSNTNQGGNSANVFKDEDIQTLVNLGFSREEAVATLRQTNGNVELAASLLFQ